MTIDGYCFYFAVRISISCEDDLEEHEEDKEGVDDQCYFLFFYY